MRKFIWFALLVLLWTPAFAVAATYEISDYQMEIDIQNDGSGLFQERVEYVFDGIYNGFLATIRHHDVILSDLRVFVDDGIELLLVDTLSDVPNTYTVTREDDRTYIKTYTPGDGDTRVFSLRYKMDKLAWRYLDAGHINQMLLVAESDYHRASFRIGFPERDMTNVEVFPHGAAYESAIDVENGSVRFTVDNIQDGDRIEVQALFPAIWLFKAPLAQSNIRPSVLGMEAQIGADMASARARAEARDRILHIALSAALTVYAVGFLVVIQSIGRKYGYKRLIDAIDDQERLSAIPAAVAQALLEKDINTLAVTATVMELVESGALCISGESGDIRLAKDSPPPPLLPHQEYLLKWLFDEDGAFGVRNVGAEKDLKAAQAFLSRYDEWKALVKEDAIEAGWLYQNEKNIVLLLLLILLFGVALTVGIVVIEKWLLTVPMILLCAVFSFSALRIRRLTDEGELCTAALKGFLKANELQGNIQEALAHAPLAMSLGLMRAECVEGMNAQDGEGADSVIDWTRHGHLRQMLLVNQMMYDMHTNCVNLASSEGGDNSSGGGFSGGDGGSSHGAW